MSVSRQIDPVDALESGSVFELMPMKKIGSALCPMAVNIGAPR